MSRTLGLGLIAAALLILFSQESVAAAQEAAQVFATGVMPALFPMMVAGSLISGEGNVLRTKPAQWGFPVLFGFLAGSPASARQLAAMHRSCPMRQGQRSALLCMSGVMSPMFFTGTLATRIGPRNGWILLLCHWLSALLTGTICLIACQSCRGHSGNGDQTPPSTQQKDTHASNLPAAITGAAQSLLSVLGAMMLFAIAAAVLKALLYRLFPTWTASHQPLLAVLWAMLEVGGGSFAVLDSFTTPPLWLLCSLCSFGGLSIWLQNLLFLDHMIRPMELLCWRMLHGALGAVCCYGAMRATGWAAEATTASIQASSVAAQAGPETAALWLSLGLLVILAWLPRRSA